MGIVTLTTDFGLRDSYVGAMKGVLLTVAPETRIVDLSHDVAPQNLLEAAFVVRGAWRFFPTGTVHVVVVDPGVGSSRAILAARGEGHLFLAPDNGVLWPVFEQGEAPEVRRLDAARFALPRVSSTFHGRDVFAPAAAHLARGFPFESIGPPHPTWARIAFPKPERGPDGSLRGSVVRVDRFGNLITNLGADLLGSLGAPETIAVTLGGVEIRGLVATYASAPPGRRAALVGSSDLLEIAVPGGSAADSLGLGFGAEVVARGTGERGR